jgi:hypothetical protein
MKSRPKIGEPRKTRQPLKVDLLPLEWRDQLLRWHNVEGRSWKDVEELSRKLPWKALDAGARGKFPDERIPETTLLRWYDITWRQKQQRSEELAAQTEQIIGAFAARGYKDLPAGVRNALTEQVFRLSKAAGEKDSEAFTKQLGELFFLLVQERKVDVQKEKIEIERDKLRKMTSKVADLKRETSKKKLEPAELQKRLDEIYGIAN